MGWWFCCIIMLCSWDVEEVFVVGLVEWVEENVWIFQDCVVGYLNMDVVVNGNFIFNVDVSFLF